MPQKLPLKATAGSKRDMSRLDKRPQRFARRRGSVDSDKTPAGASTGPCLASCDETGPEGQFARASEASSVERSILTDCSYREIKTLGDVGTKFHGGGDGVGTLHKRSRSF